MSQGKLGAGLVLAAALCVSGCSESGPVATGSVLAKNGRVAAVLSDHSAGTNPYHRVFRRPWFEHPSSVIPGFPADAPALSLTLGEDWARNVEQDAALWEAMELGRVYWVPGTNLLLYKHTPGPGLTAAINDRPIYNDDHGTGTSSAMAKACPECYVLVMHDVTSADGATVRIVAEEMPWVDFSASTQVADSTAQETADFALANPGSAYAQATRRLYETGRLFFAATGNTPVTGFVNLAPPLPIHNWDLPPWVVAVGGAQSACHATQAAAGDPQDFVGDFRQLLAEMQSSASESPASGTSFATPQVAAHFALALLEVRRALGDLRAPGALWAGAPQPGSPYLDDGRLTASELRVAMAQSARYFATADYDADCAQRNQALLYPTPASATPWLDMGWGYAGAAEAQQAANLVLGRATLAAKPVDAQAFMQAFLAGRSAFYGEPPPQ